MDMSKIFLVFCFTISSFYVRELQSRGINDVEQLEPGAKMNTPECVCFPESESEIRISDYISPDGNEQKRLVVYFYKNLDSDKFQVYIPNVNKQSIFPNLMFDKGDVIETFLSQRYFDLSKIDKNFFQSVFEENDVNIQSDKRSDKDTADQLNLIYFSEKKLSNDDNNQLKENGSDISDDTNLFNLSNTSSTGQSTLQITQSNQKLTSPLNLIHRPINAITNVHNNLHYLSTPVISGNNPSQKLYQPLENVHQSMENTPTATSPNDDSRSLLTPSVIKSEFDVPTPESLKLVNRGWMETSFEEWFVHEIQNVRSKRPSMSNLIDFDSLRSLLKKALYDNGIHLTYSGQLYDSNGNIIDMTKLKLHPILLGNPVDYEKLIASKKCVIPYDIPYLEALLVTLVYPPKVLAIIPLRKILLSKKPKNIILTGESKLIYDRSGCLTNKCLHRKITGLDSENNDIVTENKDFIAYNNLELSSKSEKEKKQVFPETSNEVKNEINTSDLKAPDNGLKNENSLINSHITGSQEDHSQDNNHIDMPEEVAIEPKDEDYDTVGYRIVGGNPATSSGTPVNNRGRSGDGDGKIVHKWIRIGR